MIRRKKLFLGLATFVVVGLLLVIAAMTGLFPWHTIEQAKNQLSLDLLTIEGVAGVGIGDCEGKPCISVLLEEDTPELRQKIPGEFKGFKVIIETTGPITMVPPLRICDAQNPCPAGQGCYKFEDESQPLCWTQNPCERCDSKQCRLGESYPIEVVCQ
ncbi:MAG: hypothetical protein A3J67_06305 [Parcubacteria group bacterium RIFCSPHIGHO2_02_FULL_48_10b]|nr:MAG: hypothetical protein A3J67_06305 [Parcubacteria group bacterium RIFCSPHIGHO2_02_FULL_48_10b]